MKRFLFYILILVSIAYLVLNNRSSKINKTNNFPDIKKNKQWEYVKERVFNGYNNRFYNYKGPILINLRNASPKDSLAVNQIVKELQDLLPHKTISYFTDFVGKDLQEKNRAVRDTTLVKGYRYGLLKALTINYVFKHVTGKHWVSSVEDKSFFHDYKDSKNYISKNLQSNTNQGKTVSGLTRVWCFLRFKSHQTVAQRKAVITVHLVRTLACAYYFKLKRGNENVNSENAILNSKRPRYPNVTFTYLDKFLLQKLYAPDFVDTFKAYMFKTYPWNYASSYISKSKTQIIALWVCALITVFLFVLLFSLFYNRKYQYRLLIYFVPLLLVFISVLHVIYLYQYIINHMDFLTIKHYIGYLVLLPVTALVISILLMLIDRFIVKSSMGITLQIALKMGFTFMVLLIPMLFVLIKENSIENWFFKINTFLLMVVVLTILRGVVLYLDYFSSNLIRQKDVELSQLKFLKSEAEVKLLQSQINPHFLYNALNSIASLASINASKTEKMALSLSDLFKYTINREDKKYSTIIDEVTMVENYLEVEKIRFGDRLNYKIDVLEDIKDKQIPMFIIQPLVENAIKHGVSKIEEYGEIVLIISKQKNNLKIQVLDNGPLFSKGLVSGHGLQTVHDLLHLTYGENAFINIENSPKKCISINIKNWESHA